MTLSEEKDKFLTVAKRILKTDLSDVPATLLKYKDDIIIAYTDFVNYCNEIYKLELSEQQKATTLEALNYISQKFENCLIRLNCSYVLSENLLDIPDPTTIKIINIEVQPETNLQTQSPEGDLQNLFQHPQHGSLTSNIIMALSTTDFLKLASTHINKTYSGDPLCLTSFIDSIDLLNSLATTTELKTFLVSFIRTKIDGRARDFISATDTTLERIKQALQTNIRPDNSRVVEGRILSLHFNATNPQDFTEKAENLADAYRRSLILEGMTQAKATEMTIDKTVELCRKNTRSELVKSVLEATSFSSPKDVLAKMITQLTKVKQEHQILTYRSQFNNPNSHKRSSFPKPNSNNRQISQNPNIRTNNFIPRNNFTQNSNFISNNNQTPSTSHFNRQTGRNNNNWHNTNNAGPRNQFRNGNINRNVRVFTNSGNGASPREHFLGELQQAQDQITRS